VYQQAHNERLWAKIAYDRRRGEEDTRMPLTPFKKNDRVKLKKTGQLGTVTEVREHDPSGGRGGFYTVDIYVRLDGRKDAAPFEERELEKV